MDLSDAVARRHMVRSFDPRPIDAAVLDRIIDLALATPSAGFTQGVDLVVLQGPAETRQLWDLSLPDGRPPTGSMPHPHLPEADVIVIVVVRPAAYGARYSESDKDSSPLGRDTSRWPVPFWWVDSGMVIEHLLLGATAEHLGGCLVSVAHVEEALAIRLGVPDDGRLVGAVALGHPRADERPSGSPTRRPRRSRDDVVHRARW